MNSRNIRKKLFIVILLAVLIFTSFGISFATTESELNDKKEDIDSQIAETHSEIAGVKGKMSEALTQINRLNSQIDSYENEISDLESKLADLNTQIAEKEANIAVQEEKFVAQQDLLNKRLIAMYESGSTSYLDMLLSSEGLADFLSKYYLISQLAGYDQELLQKIVDTKNSIQAEKDSLEASKNEVESSKNTIQIKKNSLSVSIKDKNNLVNTLSSEEKALEDQLEQFEADKRAIQAEIAALAKKNKNVTVTVTPSAAGYISPISGKTKSNITTGYYGYVGHTGVDFACSAGTPVLAVKSGTVVKSMALKNSNGNYRSYGEYIIIDHGDGTMTLYAHGQAGSRLVSAGQTVSQGQQIMSVGSTGNSTGPHLHFEVYVGGSRTNPTAFLP